MANAGSEQWLSNQTAQAILVYFHFISPIVIFAVFLIAFVWHSISTSSTPDSNAPQPLGPGGKPLPRGLSPSAKAKQASQLVDFSPGRKKAFTWLSALLILSFAGSGALIVLQAVLKRSESWWCGESFVVSEIWLGLRLY